MSAAGGADGDADAQRIGAAALARPDVAALFTGTFDEITSRLPGRTAAGVRVDADRVDVHVVAHYGPALRDVADGIARAVAPLLAGRALSVAVDDIRLPGETPDMTTGDLEPAD